MKKFLMKAMFFTLSFSVAQGTINASTLFSNILLKSSEATQQDDDDSKKSKEKEEKKQDQAPALKINGTNKSATFTVNTATLQKDQPVTIAASAGFSVNPTTLPADTKSAKITVTLISTQKETKGEVILRSGDTRNYINLLGYGTPLPVKDISSSPVYTGGNDETFEKNGEAFKPANNEYTMEFKIKTDDIDKDFFPYAVNDQGVGFRAYITSSGIGLYNGTHKIEISNPITSTEGGRGKFYNDDGRAHTYRFVMASDNRLFIYRDGILIKETRAIDYGAAPTFAAEAGEPVENLLKNPNFEGEFNTESETDKFVRAIEGWNILINDKYNSEQFIKKCEIDNQLDIDNKILSLQRYKWADGWSAAEIGQIVDVVPNEAYTFSTLARGGIRKDGTLLGKLKIQEVQNNELGTEVEITSDSWETYSMDYTTSDNCNQIRVSYFLERDKWGATITPLDVDKAKLTGKGRTYTAKAGFENSASDIEYFTFDVTGAYAPAKPEIKSNFKSK